MSCLAHTLYSVDFAFYIHIPTEINNVHETFTSTTIQLGKKLTEQSKWVKRRHYISSFCILNIETTELWVKL
jgi:hypothetical protein